MAIKAFEVSFLISTEEMLAFVAHRNTAVKINALSDGKSHPSQKHLGHHPPKLLEGPKKTRGRDEHGRPAVAWQKMLEEFAKAPDHIKSTTELASVLHRMGLSPKSVSPQIAMMQKKGWLRRSEPGVYQMTSYGGKEAQKLGYHVIDRRVKKKTKQKTKPAPETEAPPVAPEASNG